MSVESGPWQADTGDGWYRNPVLCADWSDPDAIRVGDDYILTASSFNRVPGLPVLRSTDLVNWRLIGHALDRLVPEEFFAAPRHGCGVWAPAIRFHDRRFWICYPDPDHGLFMVSAPDPAGPWTEPHLVLAGRGLIDPCPLWDADGQAYLVHGWARSRAGVNNRLTAYRMAPDGTGVLGSGTVIVNGDAIPGCRTLEGPKWYRRGQWYWIMAPAGGVATGWQYAFRSRQIFGPYEHRVVLARGASDVNGPHQGAWVDTPFGEDWFLHFQDRGPYGRVVHLQPMSWTEDGWPVIGQDDGSGCGTPVARHRLPRTATSHLREAGGPAADLPEAGGLAADLPEAGGPAADLPEAGGPATSDDFVHGVPGPQWTWQANPQPGWLCAAAEGTASGAGPHAAVAGLRLPCHRGSEHDLRLLGGVLGQRFPAPAFQAITDLRLGSPAVGARAGLVVLGRSYAWIGLTRTDAGICLVSGAAEADGPESPTSAPVPVRADSAVRIGVRVSEEAAVGEERPRCRFQLIADVDRTGWQPVGRPGLATPGRWIGATLGLFSTAPVDSGPAGCAHFGPFRVAGPTVAPSGSPGPQWPLQGRRPGRRST